MYGTRALRSLRRVAAISALTGLLSTSDASAQIIGLYLDNPTFVMNNTHAPLPPNVNFQLYLVLRNMPAFSSFEATLVYPPELTLLSYDIIGGVNVGSGNTLVIDMGGCHPGGTVVVGWLNLFYTGPSPIDSGINIVNASYWTGGLPGVTCGSPFSWPFAGIDEFNINPGGFDPPVGWDPPTVPLGISPTPETGVAPLPVIFDYTVQDPDDPIEALTFEWFFGDGFTATDQYPNHIYSAPGVYSGQVNISDGYSINDWHFTVHVADCGNGVLEQGEGCDDGARLDGDGCNSNCQVEVCFECSQPGGTGAPSVCEAIEVVTLADVCEGEPLVAQPTGGVGPYTYSWSTGETTQSITPAAGIYSVTVTDVNGCQTTTQATVFEAPVVVVDDVCEGQSLMAAPIGGLPPYSYLWNTGATTPSITVGPGDYSVTVTDARGCGAVAQASVSTCDFTPLDPGIPGVRNGSIAWGDYEPDGDLDLLLSGENAAGNPLAELYRNDGGTFQSVGAGLQPVSAGEAVWGDFDNDGDLDILLTGVAAGVVTTRLYRNDLGSLIPMDSGIWDCGADAIAWGDADNDGDLDALLAGVQASSGHDGLYLNYGDVFRNVGAQLPTPLVGIPEAGSKSATVGWFDIESDGDLDLLWAGALSPFEVNVYRNDDGTFHQIGATFPGIFDGSAGWADYDANGDLDLALTGTSAGLVPFSQVYENQGGGSFSTLGLPLPQLTESALAWGDGDNDGYPDLLIVGDDGAQAVAHLYQNQSGGGIFVDAGTSIIGVREASVAWGDYDGDGDLDFVASGYDGSTTITRLYDNDPRTQNTPPDAPANLSALPGVLSVSLGWDPGSDTETPSAGLSYNVRIGTTPGGSEIMSAMADPATGRRYIPALGNVQNNTSWGLKLDSGTYYWSVQAIDAVFEASPFAPEQSFVIEPVPTGTDEATPTSYALDGNFPNPFNPVTYIRFSLPKAGVVELTIYDTTGRKVRSLLSGVHLSAGTHVVSWDGRDDRAQPAASGVYFYRMESDEFVSTRRMNLLK